MSVPSLGVGASNGASTAVWVAASELDIGDGSPSLSKAFRWPVWLHDAASNEGVIGSTLIPRGWTTFDVDFYWTNVGAGSGDVVWNYYDGPAPASGAALGLPTLVNTVTVTADAQNDLVITEMATGQAVPGENVPLNLRVVRLGADAGDTLGNDAGLLGVRLRKAS